MPGGRPSTYRDEFVKQAAKLAKLGAVDADLCAFFECAPSTLYLWKLEHKEFASALQRGKDELDFAVEQSLYRRATGYTQDSVKIMQYEGQTIEVPFTEYHPPDTTSMIFWLKNRQPARWKDRHEIGGADGGPLVIKWEK